MLSVAANAVKFSASFICPVIAQTPSIETPASAMATCTPA